MGNTYKDEKRHFTDKEHDGGTCIHEGSHGTVHLNKNGDYEVRDRRGNKVGNGFSTDREAIEFLDGDFEDEDYEDDVEEPAKAPGKIRKHPKNGTEVNYGDKWTQITEEEYDELKNGGYEEVDYEDEPDAEKKENLSKALDELEKLVPENQKEDVKALKDKLLGNNDA